MEPSTVMTVVVLTLVGLACGIAIFLANRFLPDEDPMLARTEQISKYLPGMNCGACGKPGCFAYASAVAEDVKILKKNPCMVLLNDADNVAALGKELGVDLSGGEKKVAVVHCTGGSSKLFEYEGVTTCKGASQISGGYLVCPYGCLGFGDCVKVCPEDAIRIDKKCHVAVVDAAKCIGCGLCVAACPQNLMSIIPANQSHYLGCNYLSKKNIPGRDRCETGCIHCRLCVKAAEDGAVTWDTERDLPMFDSAKDASASAEKCPKKTIVRR